MQKWAGSSPTVEKICRLHNGGPSLWSTASAKTYWEKVQKELKSMPNVC
jgi:hypothetical protein